MKFKKTLRVGGLLLLIGGAIYFGNKYKYKIRSLEFQADKMMEIYNKEEMEAFDIVISNLWSRKAKPLFWKKYNKQLKKEFMEDYKDYYSDPEETWEIIKRRRDALVIAYGADIENYQEKNNKLSF